MEVVRHLAPDAWRAELKAFGPAAEDGYFQPDYHHLHEANGDGRASAWLVRDGSRRLLVIGLQVPISVTNAKDGWDLQSCNGYGGPLATDDADPDFLNAAWAAWSRAAAEEDCVAGFFRLHPLLNNRRWLPGFAALRDDRSTVFVPLADGLGVAWGTADVRHRNPVSRARRDGLSVRWNEAEDWREFAALYGRAMDRAAAAQALRFSSAYFAALPALPGAALATARIENRLVAGAVFLFGSVWAHYHLAARESDAPSTVANLLIQAGLETAVNRGLSGMHLGGGRAPAADDSLLRFKRHVGGELRTFQVGLVVTNPGRYADLNAAWTQQAGARPTWLLGYRQPLVSHCKL